MNVIKLIWQAFILGFPKLIIFLCFVAYALIDLVEWFYEAHIDTPGALSRRFELIYKIVIGVVFCVALFPAHVRWPRNYAEGIKNLVTFGKNFEDVADLRQVVVSEDKEVLQSILVKSRLIYKYRSDVMKLGEKHHVRINISKETDSKDYRVIDVRGSEKCVNEATNAIARAVETICDLKQKKRERKAVSKGEKYLRKQRY